MAGKKKAKPVDAFHENMSDAGTLVELAAVLVNKRKRQVRKERREKLGVALGVPSSRWPEIDGLESDDLFVVFLPGSAVHRDSFADLRPLLRQAVVAGCAAFETYLADKTMELMSEALKLDPLPKHLAELPLTVRRWVEIEWEYERRGWGIRAVVEEHVREISSTSPSSVGRLLGMLGVRSWAKKVDKQRRVGGGATAKQLDAICTRRNRIAHTGDREGRGRAQLEGRDVEIMLDQLESVVSAIEVVLADEFSS